MNPKSGHAGSAVPPSDPKVPLEAATANPGEVTHPPTGAAPHKAPKTKEEKETKNSWIEIEMVGEDDSPTPGEAYRITLPDNTVAEGTLDEKGFARVDGIDPGTCQITFPEMDKEAWEQA